MGYSDIVVVRVMLMCLGPLYVHIGPVGVVIYLW